MLRSLIYGFLSLFLFLTTTAQQLPVQWIRTFEGQGMASDRIADITTDNAGNVYVAGYAGNHHGAPDAFAMKRSPQGDTLWVYYYDSGSNNEDYATAIVVDNTGNTYITGNSKNASYLEECFTVKILPNGAEAWTARYSPGNNIRSYGNALVVDATGNVYVAGYTDPQSASNDWLVIKYNSAGVEQWADIINGAGNGDDEAMDIVIAPNGNPTVCGFISSGSAAGGTNAFIKQYTPTNGTAFTDTWTHPTYTGTDKAFGLGYNTAGELFVGGTTQNMSSAYDAFAISYDAAGNEQWSTIYTDATTSGSELLLDVKIDDSGNIYFTGTDYVDGFTTKINADGTQGWRKKWNGPANGSDVFHGITVDNVGNAYVTGRGVYPGPDYYGNGGIPNTIITKYNAAGDSLWTYRTQDSLNSSMGFAITYHDGHLYAGGFVTDTAWVNENLHIIIVDTSGNAIDEWTFNGRGDAITMGQLVVTDAANNVYCAATIDRLAGVGYDVAIVKYDPLGNLLWERYYSSYGWRNDTVTNMKFDPFGNLILSISTDSALLKNNYRLSLLKVDPQGNFIDTTWYNTSGSTVAKSMNIHTDGSIALAASSSVNGGMVIFFDPSFSPAWAAKVDSAQGIVTRANSVDFLPGGDIIAGGFSTSGGSIGLVQRYTPAGAKLWTTILDSAGVYDEVRDIHVNAAGEIAFTGGTGAAAMLGKIESTAGSVIWREVYNPPGTSESGVKIRFTHAGNLAFIARGWTGFVSRYYTAQYSNTGSFQWANVYSQTPSDREPLAIVIDSNNTVVTAGYAINGTTTNYDYVLAGYSSTGAVEFINTYSTPTTMSFSWDQLRDMAMDNQGNFIVTGQTASEHHNTYLFDMLTIKYGFATPVSLQEINSVERNMAIAFPNPSADGKFTLLDASPFKIISARIFDSQGRFILTVEPETEEINLSSQHAGLYVLVLERESGVREILKLVVR
jgi:hypothetical protein